jgi:hypothetical protein
VFRHVFGLMPIWYHSMMNRMAANHSAECRDCHDPISMDLSKQAPRAASVHKARLLTGEKTRIDCHEGIAHKPPEVEEIRGFDQLGPPTRPVIKRTRHAG